MGGTGAWHLATHYPDRFAAVVAASANADDRVWERLWEGGAEEHAPGSVRGALQRLERLDSPVTYAANMRHVPARALHGEDDQVVPVDHARSMVAALRESGAEVEYREMAETGHNVGYGQTRREQGGWLLRHRRKARPRSFSYATDGRWPGAYWLPRVEPDAPLNLARVEVAVTGRREVSLATADCGSLEVDLAAAPLVGAGPLVLRIDGQEFGGLRRERVALVRADSGWRRTPRLESFCPREFAQVFCRRFAIVYGTAAADPEMNRALERQARRLAAEWRRRHFASPRVSSDREVPAGVLAECGLVLFGGPAENSVTRRALEELAAGGRSPPFAFVAGGPEFRGRRLNGVDAETLGLQFAWPSPFAEGMSIAVVWGASWRALVDANCRFGNGFDWTVYENRRWFGYAVYDSATAGPDSFIRVGLYGPGWKFEAKSCWGRPPAQADSVPGGAPRYVRAADAGDAAAVWLDELLPWEVHQLRGPVGYGRSWGGKALSAGRDRKVFARGLGVKAPSRLVYRLGGAFRHLRATAGADLEGRRPQDLSAPRREHGAMIFTVRGDGRRLYRSDPLGPADGTADIDVDISGVDILELEVSAAGKYEWHLGCGAWARARLER
jgi:hypothetical protein